MIENIQSICVNTAYVFAAGVGAAVVACGVARGARVVSGGVKCVTALGLAGSLIFGGMVVTSVHLAAAKTNGVNQVEGGTNTVTQIEGTNTVGQIAGEGTNGTGTVSGPLMLGHFGRPNLMQGQPPTITDEDVAFGWRVASVSSNALPAATFTMPTNATFWESAQASGRGWGAWRIPLDGWHFTYGDDGWTNGFAWVEGYFRSKFRSRANEIRLLSERLTLCPAAHWSRYNLAASRAWCATNDVDGLVVTFENAAIGDDPTKIASAQMELFPRAGEIALRYDLSNVGDATYTAGLVASGTNLFLEVGAGTREVVFRRVHPEDWDYDGLPNDLDPDPRVPDAGAGWNLSDVWAMLAYPSNATEIADLGYPAWVANRAAEANRRLVGFTVVQSKGNWPVRLTVGGVPVLCEGREELKFALDCGAKYAFSVSDGEVSEISLLTANGVEHAYGHPLFGFPVEHMLEDMTVHWDAPGCGWVCRMADVVFSKPDAGHFFQNDSCEISATVTNCMYSAYVGCRWIGGAGISFSNPHSLCTTMTYQPDPVPDFATNGVMLVTAYEGGYAITNTYCFTAGSLAEPQTEFSMSCPEVMFLNDDPVVTNYLERVYRVSLSLRAPEGVGGTVVVSCSGETGSQLFLDERRTMPLGPGRIALGVSDGSGYASDFTCTTNVYLVSPHVGNGAVQATLSLSNGGGTREEAKTYRVIEPLRKLVTTEEYGGRIVNPSRLVWGTNAVLKVGVGAGSPFEATNVVWSVVSNSPGRIVPIDGWHATVEPTAPSGEVVVEARFNDDPIQPRFVLPIVRRREIPVRAFVISAPEGMPTRNLWRSEDVCSMFQDVNKVFSQVGISFVLQLPIENEVGTPNDWILPQHNVRTNGEGRVVSLPGSSNQMLSLFDHYQANDCVEVYFVGDLTNGNATAVWTPTGIAIGRRANTSSIAHELGHALRLLDCVFLKRSQYEDDFYVSIFPETQVIDRSHFKPGTGDWGEETGRGFYEKSDTYRSIQMDLLMYGFKRLGKCDIPDCQMHGSDSRYRIGFPPIGASDIADDNVKVYSK